MLGRWLRTWDATVLKPFIWLLARCGVAPDAVTAASLLLMAFSALLLARGMHAAAACSVLAGGLLDALDGELARHLGRDSQLGAFVDSLADHYGDFFVYLGLLWFSLGIGSRVDAVLIFIASFGSLFGSHIRARAEIIGVDLKDVGVCTRCERIILLAAGLLASNVTAALLLLAVLNNVSALQRLFRVVRSVRIETLKNA